MKNKSENQMEFAMQVSHDIPIHSYLKYGYFIDFTEDYKPFQHDGISREKYLYLPASELRRIAHQKLLDSIAIDFKSNKSNVVPLSGGLDSRLILAGLREFLPAEQIQTYTFGEPGSYDFEIGCKIAKTAGTRHVAIPMRWNTWSRETLLQTAQTCDSQGLVFYMHPTALLTQLYDGAVTWSGYAGDLVAGSKISTSVSKSPLEAKIRYLKNRRIVRSVDITGTSDEGFLPYIADCFTSPEKITYDEQIMLAEGVRKFTAPAILNKNQNVMTPQFNTPWADFFFSVPDQYRYGQNLMISSAQETFPDLFLLPSKNSLGLPLTAPKWQQNFVFYSNRVRKTLHQFVPAVRWPNHQYFDYNEAFRTDCDMKDLAWTLLCEFDKRGAVPVDLKNLWRRHQSRRANYGDALVVIASLEVCLQSKGL